MRMDSASMSFELWCREWRRLGGGCGVETKYSPHHLPLKEAAGPSWEVVCGFGTDWEQLDPLITDPGVSDLGFIIPHSSDQNLDDLGSGNNGISEPRTSVPMISKLNNFAGEEKKRTIAGRKGIVQDSEHK